MTADPHSVRAYRPDHDEEFLLLFEKSLSAADRFRCLVPTVFE
jgi:hypothetical protein